MTQQTTKEVVELSRILNAVPALNPESGGRGEWRKAAVLKDYMEKCGFPPPVHYDTPDERVPEGSRPNFVVKLKGGVEKPCIWVMTHLDVVPPGEQLEDGSWKGWDTYPYRLHVDGDKLYGRGVEDNHQAIVASLTAARRILESDTVPPNDIALLMVSAEETGSEYGLKYLLENYPELFDRDDFILVPDGGNDDGTLIEVAEKSVLWLNFHICGKQTHGSTPNLGTNAFRAMAEMVRELDRRLHRHFNKENDLFRPPFSTFEPTRHGSNVPNVNTIPGEETFSFDCRILPEYSLDDVIKEIENVISELDAKYGTRTGMEILNRLDAPAATPEDAPVVRTMKRALKTARGIDGRALGLGGSTVAALFREEEYPAIVWSTIEGVAHQANEHALISNILADADVYEYIFRLGCG